jgi:hypothetical protein
MSARSLRPSTRAHARFARALAAAAVVGAALAASAGCGGTASSGGKSSNASAQPKANVYLVAGKSFCVATGVSDYWTGMGKVTFFLVVHNSGDKSGDFEFTPVRYYDDGEMNNSVMDQSWTDDIAPGGTWRGKTPPFDYKAHEHEISRCTVEHDGKEVEISVVH